MMNKFFELEPEVAGGLGERIVMDRSTHPPIVSKLHYEFDGWLGDEIVESFPCYIVTESLANTLVQAQVSGMELDNVEVSTSEQFDELLPGVVLPRFVWLKPTGVAGVDDFGIGADRNLVVSEKVFGMIEATKPRGMLVKPYIPAG